MSSQVWGGDFRGEVESRGLAVELGALNGSIGGLTPGVTGRLRQLWSRGGARAGN